MVKDGKQEHPADALATALDRASSLLVTMGDLYNVETESFSGGNTFLVHALSTASTLIAEARAAFDDLQYSCDLTILEQPENRNVVMELATVSSRAENEELQSDAQESLEILTVQDSPQDITLEDPFALASEHEADVDIEPFAQSYLELLSKLTAAEVFAAEQQALSAPGTSQELLPLLRSMREDLHKIHSAA